MPQRLAPLIAAIAGVIAVAALLLAGADVYSHSRRGPRWWQRALAAGLAFLTAVGIPCCSRHEYAPTKPFDGAEEGAPPWAVESGYDFDEDEEEEEPTTLEESYEWQDLVATWRMAGSIASFKWGPYPFTTKQKKELLHYVETLEGNVQSLAWQGLLSLPEASLLITESRALHYRLRSIRPSDRPRATCYAPGFSPVGAGVRLEQRMPLIAKMSRAGAVKPEVVGRIMDGVRVDLEIIENKYALVGLGDGVRTDVAATAKRARERIRMLGPASTAAVGPWETVPRDARWQTIEATWAQVLHLAMSGKSTTGQRRELTVSVDVARVAVASLMLDGRLTWEESEALRLWLSRLHGLACRRPPVDPMSGADYWWAPVDVTTGGLKQELTSCVAAMRDGRMRPPAAAAPVAGFEFCVSLAGSSDEGRTVRTDHEGDRRADLQALKIALADARRLIGARE